MLSTQIKSGQDTFAYSEVKQSTSLEPEVNVPAGRFTNCLKLEIVRTIHREYRYETGTGIVDSIASTTYWLAKDVGIIKKRYESIQNHGTASPYIAEEDLTSYSVPRLP